MKKVNKYNKKGRPRTWTVEEIDKIADEMWEYFTQTPEGINSYLLKTYYSKKGLPAQYISIFAERSQYFHETIKRIKELLESRTYENALHNKVNPTVAIFGLKCNYNWNDKNEDEKDRNVTININTENGKSKLDEH